MAKKIKKQIKKQKTKPVQSKKFVAYLRVSTDRQGVSGLGLKAQKSRITDYIKGRGKIIKSFTEVESGRKFYRKVLDDALQFCGQHDAILVVAKLDRLARSTWLFANIQRTGVPFEIVGLPNNPLVLHILASVSEWEAQAISDRTKSALAVKKSQGKKLGWHNPKVKRGIKKYWKAIKKNKVQSEKTEKPITPQKVKPIKLSKRQVADNKVWQTIKAFRKEGYSFEMIARALNKSSVSSRLGGKWHQTSVMRVFQRNNSIQKVK